MFSPDLLKTQPWRWIGIVMTLVPIVSIFITGNIWKPANGSNKTITACPPGFAFALAWSIVTIGWFFSTLIAVLNFQTSQLAIFLIFSFFAVLICVLWLYYYYIDLKYVASQLLILLPLFAFSMFACSLAFTHVNYAHLLSALTILPLCIWGLVALLLSFLELSM